MVKVALTADAREVLDRVRKRRSGPLSLVIGNGCCDSTAPFLFESHLAGAGEVAVGRVEGDVDVLLDRALLELFEGREVVVDVVSDPAGDSFSCESELGMRLTMQRLPAV